jgi:hypothetical protein
LSGRCRTKRKQDNQDCRETKHNADQDAECKKAIFRSGFVFHWMNSGFRLKRAEAQQHDFFCSHFVNSLGQ